MTDAKEREEKLITEPVWLDIATGGDGIFGAFSPRLQIVLMPDGTVHWTKCDVPMGLVLYPSESSIRVRTEET